MRIFLRLKHWQLFLFTWGIPILMNVFTFSKPELIVKLFPLMMLVYVTGLFGWVYAISTELQTKLPADVKLNTGLFRVLFLIPVMYIVGLMVWLGYAINFNDEAMGAFAGALLLLHLVSMVCIFLSLRFAAKTMKSVELGRMAKLADYGGEFVLIWMSPIGIWILQPRLNKLANSEI